MNHDELKKLLEAQIYDEALWYPNDRTASEAYLQQELRKLHAAVEKYLLDVESPINDLYLKK